MRNQVGGPPRGVMIIAILTVAGIGVTVKRRAELRSENRNKLDRGSILTMRGPPKGE